MREIVAPPPIAVKRTLAPGVKEHRRSSSTENVKVAAMLFPSSAGGGSTGSLSERTPSKESIDYNFPTYWSAPSLVCTMSHKAVLAAVR